MVIDTSALLAIIFNEPHATWCAKHLSSGEPLLMSTVNLAELLIITKSKQPKLIEELQEEIMKRGIRFIPPKVSHALIAAKARSEYPLNLGDCFCYALAKEEDEKIITLDSDFRKLDLDVLIPK